MEIRFWVNPRRRESNVGVNGKDEHLEEQMVVTSYLEHPPGGRSRSTDLACSIPGPTASAPWSW